VNETIKPKVYSQYPEDALTNSSELDIINSQDASTLDELFRERVRRSPDNVAYTQFDETEHAWVSLTWAELAVQVERWQVAFRETGLEKGDRVAICYRNSVEWVVFDQAALRLGLVVVPLYTADRADNIAYVIDDSGAKLALFADQELWRQVSTTDEDVSSLTTVLVFDEQDTEGSLVQRVDDWLPELGQHFERGLAEPDDLASIVYTSGTTGRPKGVMLSHRNMLSNAYSGMRSVALRPSDRLLSFLPLSHTLERTIGYYAALMSGCSVAYNRSIPELADDMLQIRPTVLISVPRIFERIHNQIYTSLSKQSTFKRWLFSSAVRTGWRKFKVHQGIANWHPRLILIKMFDSMVASKVREKLGGQLRFVIVGGAPLSEDVAKTFISLGVPLLQGYGLTESSPVVTVNTLEKNRPNSIGMLLRGVSVKLGDNDELWVRGDNVMQGYWRKSQATQEVIVEEDDERWLRTGDRASIDVDGFLHIIGRIKDILVLANGEKVPPPDIEAAISRDSLFEQVMVVGEGKSFLSALVVLNPDRWETACSSKGWSVDTLNSPDVQDYLVEKIAQQMEDFPGYAKIRKVAICEEEWTVDSGLLTPTLKIRRPKIAEHYSAKIEHLYQGHGVHKA